MKTKHMNKKRTKRFELNKQLEKLSIRMHQKTGYSLQHCVLEAKYNMRDCSPYYGDTHDFFIYNSPEWGMFIMILEEACQ